MLSESISVPEPSTSVSLLERVKLRDNEAWSRFVRLYGPTIYRWARRAALQPSDAADVVQDVFQAVAEHIGRFRRQSDRDTFSGWLWMVTRNKVRDHLRRRAASPNALGGSVGQDLVNQLPLPEHVDEPADRLTSELAHRALELIQTDFEPSTWQAFLRSTVDEHSVADVARELGLSVAAVYKAKSRVLLRLRKELEGLLD